MYKEAEGARVLLRAALKNHVRSCTSFKQWLMLKRGAHGSFGAEGFSSVDNLFPFYSLLLPPGLGKGLVKHLVTSWSRDTAGAKRNPQAVKKCCAKSTFQGLPSLFNTSKANPKDFSKHSIWYNRPKPGLDSMNRMNTNGTSHHFAAARSHTFPVIN